MVRPQFRAVGTSADSEVEDDDETVRRASSRSPYLMPSLISLSIAILLLLIAILGSQQVDAQALNDPITQYIEGRLGNRSEFVTCEGVTAFCRQIVCLRNLLVSFRLRLPRLLPPAD
jgi:hypothetical protein